MTSMNSLQIIPVPPTEFSPTVATSSSEFVSARRIREYIPDGPSIYEQSSADKIVFTLNSADSFLDGVNSFLRFKLGIVPGTNGDAAGNFSAQEQTARFLASGGGHSLFKNLTISLSNGTQIENIERYSDLYHIIKSWTMSRDHLVHNEHTSGDGYWTSYRDRESPFGNQWVDIGAVANGARVTAGGVLTVVTGLGNAVSVGDEVCIVMAIGAQNAQADTIATMQYGRVVAIPTADAFTIEGMRPGAVTANANIVAIYRWNRSISARARAASQTVANNTTLPGTDVQLKVKLLSNFLQNNKYVPLCFLKNLRIELTLNRPSHCLVTQKLNVNAAQIAPLYQVVLGDVRYVASLVTPSEPLLNEYIKMFNNDGIVMNYISYQYNLKVIEGSVQESVIIPASCRSALGVIAAQYLDYSEGQNADTWSVDTIATTIKGNVTEYQYQVGSEFFPFGRQVQCQGVFNGDAFNHTLMCFASHSAKLETCSIVPQEWYSINTVLRQVAAAADLTNESLRFIMAVRLDRSGAYSGLDLSSSDLQLNITRSAALAFRPYLRSWVIMNRSIKISKLGSIVYS